ncbi:MAG TPA: peptidoglycan-binding domain-containing protein [Solirubrobacteraceae bacterium]|jgi:peptidoglycan hydrolase-like protein with peptidoglycan-binding domain|nr:peptidoglycan-binding domain-containing protein [Solirubrobacteraceae bacterium]
MTRSLWAAVAGALAFALTPGAALAAHGSPAVRSAGGGAHRDHPISLGGTARMGRPKLLAPGNGYERPAGSRQVRWLQQRLVRLGFRPGPVDGRYGPLTAGAVERLQAASGLVVDGIAGRHTLAMLSHMKHAVLAPGAGYEQRAGSRRVRGMQRRLRRLGFSPGPIDGRYGPLTMRAIRRFQHARHLPATGVMGRRTFVALNGGGRPQAPARRTPVTLPAPRVATPPARHRPQPETPLPVGLVLLALAALGLTATADGYRKTRRRIQAGRPGSRDSAGHHPGETSGPPVLTRPASRSSEASARSTARICGGRGGGR